MTNIFVNCPSSLVHVCTNFTQLGDVMEKLLWNTTHVHTCSYELRSFVTSQTPFCAMRRWFDEISQTHLSSVRRSGSGARKTTRSTSDDENIIIVIVTFLLFLHLHIYLFAKKPIFLNLQSISYQRPT